MKIVDLKTYVVGNPPPYYGGNNFTFLKITTDDGIEGWGEPSLLPFEPHSVVGFIEDLGERFVIGADPFKIEKLWHTLYRSDQTHHPDLIKMGVISAFEMACWDIVGKALDQPIYNLLGGQYHEKLRTYTYLYPAPGDDELRVSLRMATHIEPDRAAASAASYVKQGFPAGKLDPIRDLVSLFNPTEVSLERLDQAEAVIRSVREAVGNKCDVIIGTHAQQTTNSAIRFARRLEEYDPLWLEEPVPPENRDEMARVARSTSISIAAGERLSTKYEFGELLEKQAAVILQMALGRVGGILEAKKIASMAEVHYAQIAPWMHTGPIASAASIQLATCSPNFLILEGIETWGGFQADVLKEPIDWENGYVIPPTTPGLGVEPNEEVMAKHPYHQVLVRG